MVRKLTNRLNRLWYSLNFQPIRPLFTLDDALERHKYISPVSRSNGRTSIRAGIFFFFLFNGEKVSMATVILFRMPELMNFPVDPILFFYSVLDAMKIARGISAKHSFAACGKKIYVA